MKKKTVFTTMMVISVAITAALIYVVHFTPIPANYFASKLSDALPKVERTEVQTFRVKRLMNEVDDPYRAVYQDLDTQELYQVRIDQDSFYQISDVGILTITTKYFENDVGYNRQATFVSE